MENRFLDKIAQPFNVELPEAESMETMLDQVLPIIRANSEDLMDQDRGPIFINTNFLEMKDDVNFHSTIWHLFKESGEYLIANNGDVSSNEWEFVSGNKIILGRNTRDGTLYELAFLDDDFFILQRHGSSRGGGGKKYFVLVREPLAKQLEWNEAIEYLFDKYRNSNNFIITVAVIVLLVIAIVLLLS